MNIKKHYKIRKIENKGDPEKMQSVVKNKMDIVGKWVDLSMKLERKHDGRA